MRFIDDKSLLSFVEKETFLVYPFVPLERSTEKKEFLPQSVDTKL